MAYSGLKGKSITAVLGGDLGVPLNPAGGKADLNLETQPSDVGENPLATGGSIESVSGGAKGIVDSAFAVAAQAGGDGVFVVSDSRPGATTTSGNVSDHASNDATRAARDIAVRGINAITGPPSPKLDKAVVAIGALFGRSYSGGQRIVDTFTWKNKDDGKSYRIQIIWRTPEYGGHMGHIHVGARVI